jgi:eukaryotic-like serine/threonine-protein kinase
MEDIRTTLTPGTVFAGKYRIERVLGEGGMGVVLSAVHVYTDDRVALKFLLPEAAGRLEVRTRFMNEARAAVQIKSEHVARVTDVDVLPSGVPYMVMEYLEGQDLGEVVAQSGALPLATAADYVLQACEALAEAHALGIVHRDLKPSNLFLTHRKDGSPLLKVLDFGISKLGAVTEASVQLTKTSSLMGSPLYMSPEQMTSPKQVDSRSDVWSMGVVLYELLTGDWPFQSETVQGLAVEIITQPHRPIRSVCPALPEEIEVLVGRCLEKVVTTRLSSVGELARALAPFASAAQSGVSVERVSRVLLGPHHPLEPASVHTPLQEPRGATSAEDRERAGAPASTSTHGALGDGATGAPLIGGLAGHRSRSWQLVVVASLLVALGALGTVLRSPPPAEGNAAVASAPSARESAARSGPSSAVQITVVPVSASIFPAGNEPPADAGVETGAPQRGDQPGPTSTPLPAPHRSRTPPGQPAGSPTKQPAPGQPAAALPRGDEEFGGR